MVNLVTAHRALLHGLMKMAGIRPYRVEIEPGTVMNFWVPSETITKPNKNKGEKPKIIAKPNKPAVVLIHGFSGDGIVTWQFQISGLTKKYAVYVPDLLFFGRSVTDKTERSTTFQAECLVTSLRTLGVEKCIVVGFSYGGMVAFKMGELYPELVQAMVISGSVIAMTKSISVKMLQELRCSSFSEFLLPTCVKDLRALFSLATYKKLSLLPDRFFKDFLEVMFDNRKERSKLLEGMVISDRDITIPKFPQRIHLLWGQDDQIFKLELAQNVKQQLGEGTSRTTFEGIKKAGHLVHLERPCVYNRCLKHFIASFLASIEAKK